MKNNSDQPTPATPATNCPKTGQPVIDMGTYYRFAGFPSVAFTKKICGTDIGVGEYFKLLSNVGEPGTEYRFISKAGKPFKGRLVFTGNQTEFYRVLDASALCPLTNKPASITEKAIYFDGFPKVPFWTEFRYRRFSAQDWVKVLSNSDGCTFDDFPSRSGKLNAGRVWFDSEKKEIKFEYVNPA